MRHELLFTLAQATRLGAYLRVRNRARYGHPVRCWWKDKKFNALQFIRKHTETVQCPRCHGEGWTMGEARFPPICSCCDGGRKVNPLRWLWYVLTKGRR